MHMVENKRRIKRLEREWSSLKVQLGVQTTTSE